MDLEERVVRLESEVKQIHERYLVANAELRRPGIENGSKGVKGGFFLFAFVFSVNAAYAYATGGKDIFSAWHLIGLGALLCLALVAYFGFIFRYTVSAEFAKDKLSFGTGGHPSDKPGA
jgi:hypothetical protein